MTSEVKTLDFKNQQFYIGIDVHDKSWTVTISSNQMELDTFRMNPDPKQLANRLKKLYPGGEFFSTYEAGFCGFWIHRELIKEGINNIVVSPAHVPTSWKEEEEKRDPIDSRKLARELGNRSLKGIYILTPFEQELRSLVRFRYQQSRNQARLKNQIKSYLHFSGIDFPSGFESRHWSRSFIDKLNEVEFDYEIGKRQLEMQLNNLNKSREALLVTLRSIREVLKRYELSEKVLLLSSVPGIGFITAITLLTEIIDINRFEKFDKLAKYCGLVPSTKSSGDKKISIRISRSKNKLLRQMLVESAWTAIRKDPALTRAYNQYLARMSKQEAIIRIAKKLLSRTRYVWKTGNAYVKSVIE